MADGWTFWNDGDTEMVFEVPGKVIVSIQPEGVAYTVMQDGKWVSGVSPLPQGIAAASAQIRKAMED